MHRPDQRHGGANRPPMTTATQHTFKEAAPSFGQSDSSFKKVGKKQQNHPLQKLAKKSESAFTKVGQQIRMSLYKRWPNQNQPLNQQKLANQSQPVQKLTNRNRAGTFSLSLSLNPTNAFDAYIKRSAHKSKGKRPITSRHRETAPSPHEPTNQYSIQHQKPCHKTRPLG